MSATTESLPYVHKLIVIEESRLASLANNDRFTREFPFLKGLKKTPKGRQRCGTCGTPDVRRSTAFQSAKATIAQMGQAQKRKLKQMLQAKHVRVIYPKPGGGGQIELTF